MTILRTTWVRFFYHPPLLSRKGTVPLLLPCLDYHLVNSKGTFYHHPCCLHQEKYVALYFILIRENGQQQICNISGSNHLTSWQRCVIMINIIRILTRCSCYFQNASGEFVNFPHCVLKRNLLWPLSHVIFQFVIFPPPPQPLPLPLLACELKINWKKMPFLFIHFRPEEFHQNQLGN